VFTAHRTLGGDPVTYVLAGYAVTAAAIAGYAARVLRRGRRLSRER